MKTNYHTHCNFCDGIADPETVVKIALEKGFDVLGFSSHSPLEGEEWPLAHDEVHTYIQTIRGLQKKYEDQILILAGMERDFIVSESPWQEKRWEKETLDFVIGSIHMVFSKKLNRLMSVDGPQDQILELIDKGYDGNARGMVEDYYDNLAMMVKRETFDFVGHIDVVKKRNKVIGFLDESDPWYMKKVKTVLEVIHSKSVPIEINTGGIFRGATDELYPSQPILRECFKKGIPIVISSDSHDPQHLDSGFDLAVERAGDAGYKKQMILDRNGWRSIAL
ncbi:MULTISPECIES: histidinol-phosphatase [unclassified Oceanispirochaeta]|uniref:histidinol-phosphatase n=1 Tax=unclassified Oceanispirochaeta TaxID=2635722 RepID=UPI000E09A9D1|nr:MULTISPECIES: histidinol-phosphatase [unclassified Oceanispirochaeta]MBF9018437.1 histidinol-phosphatase [Oceanispirochaeta sp. M2]NPD73889.1 histidinol-phosphatase [Oceanispirochaeta sp. M1]RDG30349.1 PHP domain-containing protein [Oceanispirochaeta sp. M1]